MAILIALSATACKTANAGSFEARFFKPSARVYFDLGEDKKDEVDIYNNGRLTTTITAVEIFQPIFGHGFRNSPKPEVATNPANPSNPLGTSNGPNDSTDSGTNWAWADQLWHFGVALGFGMTPPPQESEDGTAETSTAPALLLSAGFLTEFVVKGKEDKALVTIGVEVGYAYGISAAEEFKTSSNDLAWYAGLGINIPWGYDSTE